MTAPDPNAPIVIREARWKASLIALGGLVFVVIGFLMARDPKASHAMAWFAVVFFGAAALLGVAQVVRPAALILEPSGFTVRQVTSTWSARWSEVSNFRIWQVRTTRYVRFDYVGERRQFGSFPGTGMLPANWTLSPPKLIELMKDCKARWG